MKLNLIACLAVLLACQFAAAEPPDTKPAKENLALAVSLRLSSEEFDPSKPTGTITCVAVNKSDQEIVLPAEYDGKSITLHANRLRLWRRDLPAKDRPAERLTIAPGKEQKLFELPLAEILLQRRADVQREQKWGWDWDRRLAPPSSPIHKLRESGYVESARFQVEIQVNGGKTLSEPVTLKVKDSGQGAK